MARVTPALQHARPSFPPEKQSMGSQLHEITISSIIDQCYPKFLAIKAFTFRFDGKARIQAPGNMNP